MKKLLLLTLISAGLFAARYPIIAEYYFMNSCVNAAKGPKDKMIRYCACTLNEIEKHYTLKQFIQNMQTNKEAFLKEIAKTAIPKCINQLTK